MSRSHPRSTGRRVRRALAAAVLGIVSAGALVTAAGAAPPIGPSPATTNGVSLVASPVDGLVDGQNITYTVNTTGATKLVGSLSAHICAHGLSGYGTGNFGYSGGTATRCVYQAGIVSGGLGTGDYEKIAGPFGGTESTSGALTFKAGTGSVTWGNVTGGGPFTVQADATHQVDLVVEVNLAGDSVPRTYFVQPLTFAGQPAAPTAVGATSGDASSHVTWTAPSDTGNSTVTNYVVTATQTGGAADPSSPRTLTVGNVLAGDIPLQNFSTYDITVQTKVAASVPLSAASSPAVSVSPLPGPPTGVTGSPAAGGVNVSWTAPPSTSGLTSYSVTATPNVGSPITVDTGSTATSYLFAGLDNGTPYTFVVKAAYGSPAGPFGLPSNASGGVTPSNKEVDQLITVERPQGALVLTQACDASNPTPYPVDGNGVPNPVYPTDPAIAAGSCSVNLGKATFVSADQAAAAGFPAIGEGQFFKASGAMNPVAIVDTRDSDVGWNVNGLLKTNFTSGSKHFSAHQLGWQPGVTDRSAAFSTPDGSYANDATKGGDVLPASHAADTALGSSQLLAGATVGHGLGIAHLNATLNLLIPVFAQSGVYSAVLQITAI